MFQYLGWVARRCAGMLLTTRRSRVQSAVEEATADVGPLLLRVRNEIGQGKQRIAGRVAAMQRLTEQEVLACGSALSAIFDHVGKLIAEADSAAVSSLGGYEQATSRFVAGMQQDSQAQEAAAKQVLHLARGIEDAIAAIDALARSAKMLAINTRIEAARIGQQGQAFAVISDNMRELSGTIQDVAQRVKGAIGAVREGVPPVMDRAASMHARTESFVDDVAAQVKAAALRADVAASGRLDRVVKLSNAALSHLQFQDRLQQNLTAIDLGVGSLEDRLHRTLDGEIVADAAEEIHPGDGEPGTGAVLLF